MINLVQFYTENHTGYYDKYASQIVGHGEYRFLDTVAVIDELRNICKPPEKGYEENNIRFVLLCFWLYKNGYSIKEFPNLLVRPISLYNFGYIDIRKYITKRDGGSGTVSWWSRRELCDELTISSENNFQTIPDEIDEKIKLISTRGADFNSMEVDEKLALLNNLIENLLKKGDKFRSISYKDVFFGYFSEQQVIDYRKSTHCFRHGTEKAIEERKKYSKQEKTFLIDAGVFIALHIHGFLDLSKSQDQQGHPMAGTAQVELKS